MESIKAREAQDGGKVVLYPRAVGIVGTGSYVPERVMKNSDLEKIVDTSDEWISRKTGIRERRIAAPEEATSDLAVRAALTALTDANITSLDLDLIILATSSPDMIQPPVACIVQGRIGAYNAGAFDLGAVCSGFTYALSVASDLMKGNDSYRTVLVIAAETYSKILDWTDRKTCVYFGDGASAVVLRWVKDSYGILASYLRADGRGWDVIKFPAGGTRFPASKETVRNKMHSFQMKGKRVWDFAIEAFPDAVIKGLSKCNLTLQNLDFLICHQANAVLIKACLDKLGISLEKTYLNVDRYGNTSGASAGIALDEAVKLGKIKNGDIVIIVGFGGGLTWGSVVLRWLK